MRQAQQAQPYTTANWQLTVTQDNIQAASYRPQGLTPVGVAAHAATRLNCVTAPDGVQIGPDRYKYDDALKLLMDRFVIWDYWRQEGQALGDAEPRRLKAFVVALEPAGPQDQHGWARLVGPDDHLPSQEPPARLAGAHAIPKG